MLRVDNDTLLIERFNGKEVRLYLDPTVKNGNRIDPGDRIEAKLEDLNHEEQVLSIREIN